MKIGTKSRRLRAVGVATVLLGTAGLAACDFTQDGDADQIAVVGSDTTQDVMGAILAASEADPTYNSDPDNLVNVRSQEPSPGVTVPADDVCGSTTYQTPPDAGEVLAPNGSSAGRDALRTAVIFSSDCIDIARSSSGPRAISPTGDLATFEYYAFALDAAQLVLGEHACAPATLTSGSDPGHLQLHLHQLVPGRRLRRRHRALLAPGRLRHPGRSPRATCSASTRPPSAIVAGCGGVAPTLTQENSGQDIAANGDQQRAIVPYSAANFVAQVNGHRAGPARRPERCAGSTTGA